MPTPSTLNTALAEKLLVCNGGIPKCYCGVGLVDHSFACPAAYRPAVASALQSKDDEIARLKGEIGRLREALEPFKIADDLSPNTSDYHLIGIRMEHLRKARAALQIEGEKL